MKRTRSFSLRLVLAALPLALFGPVAGAQRGGGEVLPGNARPHGWTLADMTKAMASFTVTGNNPAYYPDTPFQILYADFGFGGGNFTVFTGTPFFVPLMWSDDSPPIIGTFPSSAADAIPYIFDQTQIGFSGEIEVDGRITAVGPEYIGGPVTTPPLLDGGGTHIVSVGVFLTPMSPGQHTVTIRGVMDGDAILLPPFNGPWVFEFTFLVAVVEGR